MRPRRPRKSPRPCPLDRAAVLVALVLAAGLLPACSPGWGQQAQAPVTPVDARVEGDRLVVATPAGDTSFLAGVNLGATIPGHAPGELAVPAETYRQWFPQMVELGFQVVRAYTILPPAFYAELAAYNRSHADRPLYFVQGVWIPEERFLATRDLFDPGVQTEFRQEIADASEAVHGTLRRETRPGHASGRWEADASPWLVSYLIGIEWDPAATAESDRRNASATAAGGRFTGRFFTATSDASPTESWLASMLDHLATIEDGHGRSLPLAFVNWVTADPLRHPEEPRAETEDLVSIDANHVRATPAWRGGTYASYHVYPYYPDFLRFEPGLQQHLFQGEPDPYAGYLAALKRHHADMPVLVTEFGVPASVGSAHLGTRGRDQGDHSEQEAMAINAQLLRVIHGEGMAGGFVFEWADEWFKLSWNTMDLEVPGERRPLWQNVWTNEAHFGLVAMQAGRVPDIVIDGDGGDDEWEADATEVIFKARSGPVAEVRATEDESYLYLRLLLPEAGVWERAPLTLGFDLIRGGAGGLPDLPGVHPEADAATTLGPGPRGQAWARASNDPFTHLYGQYLDPPARDRVDTTGAWHPSRLMLNRPLRIPSTGQRLASETFDVGALRFGTSDPGAADFDARTAWAAAGKVVELRLPYAALGIADPSSHQALVTRPDGTLGTESFGRVGVSIVVDGQLLPTSGVRWEGWQSVRSVPRLKAGLDVFASAVREVSALSR